MWFTFAVLTIFAWGGADLFYKLGAKAEDKYSHLKTVIAVGIIMGAYAVVYMLANDLSFSPMSMITYLPVSAMYILSMTLGYVGLRYMDLSVSSPVQNSSGAVTALLCFAFLGQRMELLQLFAVVLITLGLILLSVFEKKQEHVIVRDEDKKYRTGMLAIIFPLLYCLIDGLGTFFDGIWLNEDNPIMSEDEALLAYMFTFAACAVLSLLYLAIFKPKELKTVPNGWRFGAAALETAGQYFYVFAISKNAIVVAPLIASYSVVSVLLSRVFLKERLAWYQYGAIVVVMVGIAILGLFD